MRGNVFPRPAFSKFRNRRCVCNGIEFHSVSEARRYAELLILQEKGEISNLELQPRFPITIEGTKIATYIADFAYFTDKTRIVEDVKGFATPLYRIKKKLVEAIYRITIVEIRPRRGKPSPAVEKWLHPAPQTTSSQSAVAGPPSARSSGRS